MFFIKLKCHFLVYLPSTLSCSLSFPLSSLLFASSLVMEPISLRLLAIVLSKLIQQTHYYSNPHSLYHHSFYSSWINIHLASFLCASQRPTIRNCISIMSYSLKLCPKQYNIKIFMFLCHWVISILN